MANNNYTNYVGPSFVSLLTILFIGLKLTNYINWSWWIILSPMIVIFGLYLCIILVIGVLYLLYTYLNSRS
jgi:hypothetical protein